MHSDVDNSLQMILSYIFNPLKWTYDRKSITSYECLVPLNFKILYILFSSEVSSSPLCYSGLVYVYFWHKNIYNQRTKMKMMFSLLILNCACLWISNLIWPFQGCSCYQWEPAIRAVSSVIFLHSLRGNFLRKKVACHSSLSEFFVCTQINSSMQILVGW